MEEFTESPVQGAEVTISSLISTALERGLRKGTVTSSSGEFVIRDVSSGGVLLAVAATSFQPATGYFDIGPCGQRKEISLTVRPGSSVSGGTLDATTLEAVGGAVVCASAEINNFNRCVESDVEGRYTIPDLPSGVVFVTISKTPGGYAPPRATKNGMKRLFLSSGNSVEGINFSLVKGNSIHGTVVTRDGSPIAGAFVRIVPSNIVPSYLRKYTTGKDGRFHYSGIKGGMGFEVVAEAQGFSPSSVRVEASAAQQPYDDLLVTLDGGARVSGRIVNKHGSVITNTSFVVRAVNNRSPFMSSLIEFPTVTHNGKYELLGLPAGEYKFLVRRVDSLVAVGDHTLSVAPLDTVEGLDIAIDSDSERFLSGYVVDSRERPIADAQVFLVGWRSLGFQTS